MHNHLLDQEFLKQVFSVRQRETYARVISLSIDEQPLETLEGKITQGNVNIDGKSAVRRTCNLTFATTADTAITDYYWALTNKFKLEIGIKNFIDTVNYPEILWFPLGVYVITSFNLNKNINSLTCSIQGKDKMCLLNGDVNGSIYATTDFGTIDMINANNTKERVDLEIKDIIRDIVHLYANEPYQNIVIKDIPNYGEFLYKFVGNTTTTKLYAYISLKDSSEDNKGKVNVVNYNKVSDVVYGKTGQTISVNIPSQFTKLNGREVKIKANSNFNINIDNPLLELDGADAGRYVPFAFYDSNIALTELEEDNMGNINPTKILINNEEYIVAKVEQGQAAGYKITSLTYPRKAGDDSSGLICGVGESITAALDKIVGMLGDYEYFYNEQGQFVFQKRNSHIDTNWQTNSFEYNSLTGVANMNALPVTYWNFEDGTLVSSYSNTPNLGNIKNDFAIWGEDNNELALHMRYAIDDKPLAYNSITVTEEEAKGFLEDHPEIITVKPQESISYINDNNTSVVSKTERAVDWREIIYQMASDYLKYNHFDSFEAKVRDANPQLYPAGITGYEQYYTDIYSFWRDLYDPVETSDLFNKEVTINHLDLTKSGSGFKKEIYVKGRFELPTDSKKPNAIIAKDIENKPYIISLEEYGKTELIKKINNSGLRLIAYKDGNGQIIDPYAIRKEPNCYIGNVDEKENMIYCTNLGYWDYLDEVEDLPNSRKLLNYDIVARILENKDLLTVITNYNALDTHKNDESFFSNNNLDFLTVYKVENKYYTLISYLDGDKWKLKAEEVTTSYLKGQSVGVGNGDDFFHVRRYGRDNIISRIQMPNPNKKYPNEYAYYNGRVEFAGRLRPDWKEIEDIENLEVPEGSIYAIVNPDEEAYTAISKMPKEILSLFVNGDIYDRTRYLTEYRVSIRANSGDLMGRFKKYPIYYYQLSDDKEDLVNGWKSTVKNPETLNFWFDFFDSPESEIGKMRVKSIMDRTKTVNENEIKAIYYRENLRLFFFYKEDEEADEEIKKKIAEQYRLMPYIDNSYSKYIFKDNKEEAMFDILNVGKSCKEVLDQYLYNYTYASSTVNIAAIPVYHLRPGDVVSLNDNEAMLQGNYIINSLSIPLTYNGTMSINATKQIQALYN